MLTLLYWCNYDPTQMFYKFAVSALKNKCIKFLCTFKSLSKANCLLYVPLWYFASVNRQWAWVFKHVDWSVLAGVSELSLGTCLRPSILHVERRVLGFWVGCTLRAYLVYDCYGMSVCRVQIKVENC